MTYLDTHVAAWLYRGDIQLLSEAAREQIEKDDLLISPAVVLELEYLREIGRLKPPARKVIEVLSKELDLRVCELPFLRVVEAALTTKWVRDPFDRLIVAQASASGSPLITRDEEIRQNYSRSIW